MSRVDEVLQQIADAYERRKNGTFNAIPFPFKKLNKVVPGIIPGLHYLMTAGTKVGKSKFSRQVFVIHPYQWAKKYNYKTKIFYFPLEDSADRVLKFLLCNQLLLKYGMEFTPEMLNAYDEHCAINDALMERIMECADDVREMEQDLVIMDTVRTCSGLFKIVYDELMKHGEIEYDIIKSKDGKDMRVPKRFVNKDNTHFIVVLDNLNNIEKEDHHRDQRAAIDEWTEKRTRQWLCNFFGVTVINIQQQAPAQEQQQYTNGGQLIWEKLMPSISGLGDNKATAQTAHIVFGLFSPYRHGILAAPGIPVSLPQMKDFYRHFRVIASNIGESPIDLGIFFDGLTEFFGEMPSDEDGKRKMYDYVKRIEQRRGLVGNSQSDLMGPFAELL